MAKITSLILHIAALLLLLLFTSRSLRPPAPALPELRRTPLYLPVLRSGGSNQTDQRAKRGVPPPRAFRTFIPPSTTPNPRLAMPITVAFESPTFALDTASIGDPSSSLLAGKLGRLGGNSIGDRSCCGDFGPGPSGSRSTHHSITSPQLIYKVEPEFSEEARRAKYQGTVVLAIEVDTSGRPNNLRVIQGLGLGLDEKAIEAVARWRFRPGSEDGKPTVTSATVEVSFHLL